MATSRSTRNASTALLDDGSDPQSPIACADSLGRTAVETCRQHERLSRLNDLRVDHDELRAAHALVDTCDLALAECVAIFEKTCGRNTISENTDVQSKATTLWMAAREYLRRHSIAEKASRQLTHHDVEKLTDLQLEYEFMASALLALKQATASFGAIRPEAR